MKIEKISITNEGYIRCGSNFYSTHDVLQNDCNYNFTPGAHKLYGEIDSGVWGISYLLSMYNCKKQDFVLFKPPEVVVNNITISLDEFMKYSCYMDESYPLFSEHSSVKKLITRGIKKNGSSHSPDDIRNLFHIDQERFERPLSEIGNVRFRAMAAIGYSYGKEVFCFPWLSEMRFQYYHMNISMLLEILSSLNKISILPLGQDMNFLKNK